MNSHTTPPPADDGAPAHNAAAGIERRIGRPAILRQPISVRINLEADDLAALERYCAVRRISKSEAFRTFIRQATASQQG